MLSEVKFDDRVYLVSQKMRSLNIKNGFSSSLGGVSLGNVKGLNLGFRVGDRKEDVLENYRLVAGDLGFDINQVTAGRQTHSTNIKVITEKEKGFGITKDTFEEEIDGLITGEKNIPLVVYSADCYGVLLADSKRKAVGAVHSGWRGTLYDISGKAVLAMNENFNVHPEDVIAAIGPGIGKCCFEVDLDVALKFEEKYVTEKENNKFLVDLVSVIKDNLLKMGLKEENILISNRCTVCENDKFYSYRSHKDKTGRMGAFISL